MGMGLRRIFTSRAMIARSVFLGRRAMCLSRLLVQFGCLVVKALYHRSLSAMIPLKAGISSDPVAWSTARMAASQKTRVLN
jgi:hypothetical protein